MDDVFGFGDLILIIIIIIFCASIGSCTYKQHIQKSKDEVVVQHDTIKVVDTVKVVAKDTTTPTNTHMPSNTDLIFYKIPADKLLEYTALCDVWKRDTLQGFDCYNNQKKWDYLRKLFGRDFEAYMQDGITYSWCICEMNSNNIVVFNGGRFDLTDEQIEDAYVRYIANNK
jgi:hypothetical protein